MKRTIILTSIFLCNNIILNAQGLTGSAEGKSSVLFQGSNIGINLGASELSFGLNSLNRAVGEKCHWLIGGELKGNSADGIADLFNRGGFVPAASLNGFTGVMLSNATSDRQSEEKEKLINKLSNIEEAFSKSFSTDMESSIRAIVTDTVFRAELLNELKNTTIANKFLEHLNVSDDDSQQTKNEKKKVPSQAKELINKHDKEKEGLNEQIDNISDYPLFYQLSLFGFGGINASEFKHFTAFDTLNLANSFNDVSFRGGRGGVGLNFDLWIITVGVTYSYFETSNFKLLTKKDYTLRKTQTVGNQILVEEKKITAYSGNYTKTSVNEINADLIFNIRINPDTAAGYILINPYLHSQLFSRNKERLPSSTDVGIGLYFFRKTGKFFGGLYTELSDVKDNYEKLKPLEDQNLRKPLEKLTFGVIARFSILSRLS